MAIHPFASLPISNLARTCVRANGISKGQAKENQSISIRKLTVTVLPEPAGMTTTNGTA